VKIQTKDDLILALEMLISRVRRARRLNAATIEIRQSFDWDDYQVRRAPAPTMVRAFATLTLDLAGPFAPIPEPPTRCRCGLTIGHEPTCPELDQ
jgi:hypothetical protein